MDETTPEESRPTHRMDLIRTANGVSVGWISLDPRFDDLDVPDHLDLDAVAGRLSQTMIDFGYDRVQVDGTEAEFTQSLNRAVWGLELLKSHSNPGVAMSRHVHVDLATGSTSAIG